MAHELKADIQRELKALRLIAKDMEQDVVDLDGSPFNGKTMGVTVGRLSASIYALAKIMEEHISDRRDHMININRGKRRQLGPSLWPSVALMATGIILLTIVFLAR